MMIDPKVSPMTKLSEIQPMAVRRGERWLVSNGQNMGRWTYLFGVHCIADSPDCLEFQRNITEGMDDVEFLPVTITLAGNEDQKTTGDEK